MTDGQTRQQHGEQGADGAGDICELNLNQSKGATEMNYQQAAREIDALDERNEEISERLDEIEEALEYEEHGTERTYELLDEKEELEQEQKEIEERKAELTTDGFTRWDNGF